MQLFLSILVSAVLGSLNPEDVDLSCFSRDAPVLFSMYQELAKLTDPKEPAHDPDDISLCKFGPGDRLTVSLVGELVLGDRIGGGCTGDVFLTNNPDFVVKVSSGAPLTREQAVLVVANGLSGYAPRMYPIKKIDKPECANKILVMDKVGDSDWMSDSSVPLDWTYTRFVQLLKAVEQLHAIGFAHRDIRTCNVRVDKSDPRKIFLVDFGIAESILYTADKWPRKLDLDNMVDFLPHEEPATAAYTEYVENLDENVCPNYPALVGIFDTLAKDPKNEDILEFFSRV